MKRRDFLAASALFSLLAATPAEAAKKAAEGKASRRQTRSAGGNRPDRSAAKPAQTTRGEKAPGQPRPRRSVTPGLEDAAAEAPPPEPRNVISLPDEKPANWRTYDILSTISLKRVSGKVRLWIPLVQYKDTPWERSLGHNWQGNFQTAGIYRDPVADMEVFYADWADGTADPQLQITSQVATQDRHFDITRRGAIAERGEVLRRCLQSTAQVPTDGIVRQTAERAIGRIKDPLAQGKAIYDWVVENAGYDPSLKRVGNAHIGNLLESGNLSGRSADIALLFVGLCRSIGIPARPVFGLRIDRSRIFGSLGSSGNLNLAQQCRAEFYTPGYGWIPVNPADVRKAIRDERLTSGDPKLIVLKKLLFGFWEMNWIGFNAAQDISLRESLREPLAFLIYPVAETIRGRFDSLDAERMNYQVTASRTDL